MKKIIHSIYEDYENQPYISPTRDLKLWEERPELFPYAIVEKKQMIKLEEGLLPGDIVMLWRVHFNTFTNESIIPQYFEYRYGIDSDESISLLLCKGYIGMCSAKQSLNSLNMVYLKKILKEYKLSLKGKKSELVTRAKDNLTEEELASQFPLRCYYITDKGLEILKKYDYIIQKHGPKKL